MTKIAEAHGGMGCSGCQAASSHEGLLQCTNPDSDHCGHVLWIGHSACPEIILKQAFGAEDYIKGGI